jgi:hypothetical protein
MNYFSLISMLSVGVFVHVLNAQSVNENALNAGAKTSNDVTTMSSNTSAQTSSGPEDEGSQFIPALDGTGLIAIGGTLPKRLVIGASVSGGWDTNPDNLTTGASSAFYTLSPYVGFQASTAKVQFLLQYQPTLTGYGAAAYSKQTMHAASATVLGTVNERWTWDLNASASYGQDSTRLLAPPQNVAVGEVPGVGPNSSSYLLGAGTVTFVTGGADVHYRKSERDSVEFGVANTLSRYSGLSDNNNIATAKVGYERSLSPSLDIRAYGQSYSYYGATDCTSLGGGAGLKWHVVDGTLLSLSGGPQLNTSACGKQQILSYSAAFSTRLTGQSQIYLLAAREPTISYLGPGLWQTSASGGYQRKITASSTLRVDAGYASSSSVATVNSFHGTFVSCIYSVQLGHGIGTTYSYRTYIGDTNGASFSRNVGLFSLTWTPGAGHIFQ